MLSCVNIIPTSNERDIFDSRSLKKLSREITVFLMECAPSVERWGVEGWFVDLTGCERLFRNGLPGWGAEIIYLLRNHFAVEAKVGIASNKVLAEVACRLIKPGGVLWLFPGDEQIILNRISVEVLPRLTSAQREIFRTKRLQWVEEIKAVGEDNLRIWLGTREGSKVWRIIHGVCDDPVQPWRIPQVLEKSFTFADPTASRGDIVRVGVYLTSGLYHESRQCGTILRKISCRLIYVDGLEAAREVTMAGGCREQDYVAATTRMLENLPLRRVQIRTLYLWCPAEPEVSAQQDLFSEAERLKRRDLDLALKDVREKYGTESLHRAAGTPQRKRGQGPVQK